MHDTGSDPPLADPDRQRHSDIHYEIVRQLRENLPFHDGMSEADRARMLDTAIGSVGVLGPGNSMEAYHAARQVACLLHADICTAQAARCLGDVQLCGKLRAQSALMGREARGYLGALLRMQAVRSRREAQAARVRRETGAACPGPDDADAAGEASAEAITDTALREAAARLPEALTPPPAPVWIAPARSRHGAARPDAERNWIIPPPEPEPSEEEMACRRLAHEADLYAVIYPLRTRVIRRLGGMPPDAPFEAPEPILMAELLAAQRSNQLWADGMTPEQAMIDGGHDRMGWPYEPDADPVLVRQKLLKAGVDWQPGLPWGALSAASVGM